MTAHLEALRAVLRDHADRIVKAMVHDSAVPESLDARPANPEMVEQSARAFFALVDDELQGKHDIRELFLATAIPGLRDAGVPLSLMIGGSVKVLLRVAAELVAAVPEEVRPAAMAWLHNLFGDHLAAVVTVWEEKGQ